MLFERIVGAVMARGRTRCEAEAEAMPALRTRLANDPRLAPERQPYGRCWACGGGEHDTNALLPIMTARPDAWVWVHGGNCHLAHVKEIERRVRECIEAAGIEMGKGEAA